MVEFLLRTKLGAVAERRMFGAAESLHAPHLLDAEVLSALRRMVLAGELSDARACRAAADLAALRLERHGHHLLAARAWQLRHNVTIYDALYVALAEALDAVLVTCDRRLAAAPAAAARVQLLSI